MKVITHSEKAVEVLHIGRGARGTLEYALVRTETGKKIFVPIALSREKEEDYFKKDLLELLPHILFQKTAKGFKATQRTQKPHREILLTPEEKEEILDQAKLGKISCLELSVLDAYNSSDVGFFCEAATLLRKADLFRNEQKRSCIVQVAEAPTKSGKSPWDKLDTLKIARLAP